MATRTWNGSVSGDWSNASNWSAAPASGDDVIINTGSRNIDAGLAQGALDLNSLLIGPDYGGNIGNSDTAPLVISSAKIIVNGGGAQHYIQNGNTDINEFQILGVGPSKTGDISVSGTIVKLIVRMGHAKQYSGTTTTAILQADGGLSSTASITQFAGTITTLYKGAGIFTTEDVDEDGEDVHGTGTVTNLYNSSSQTTMGVSSTLTNAYVFGGIVYWKSTATLTLANVFGGVLDGTGATAARTITTLNAHEGSTTKIGDSIFATAITTENNYGGAVLV